MAIHDLADERQEAPLHVGETLAFAMTRLEVLVDGPFAGQLDVYSARILCRPGFDTEVDFDRLWRQRQRQVVAEGDSIGGLHRPQVRAGVDGHDRHIGGRLSEGLDLLDPFAGQWTCHAAVGYLTRIAGDVDLALGVTNEPDLQRAAGFCGKSR